MEERIKVLMYELHYGIYNAKTNSCRLYSYFTNNNENLLTPSSSSDSGLLYISKSYLTKPEVLVDLMEYINKCVLK